MNRRVAISVWVTIVGMTLALGGLIRRGLATADAGREVVQPLRALAEAIGPLHERKRPPRPGDWLENHPERGQTLAQYLASAPNTPTERLTTIYMQPIGTFDPAQEKLLSATGDLLGVFYGVPVKVLDRIDLATIPERAQRVHPTWGDHQVLTSYVRGLLKEKRPVDAVAVLALITADLWPGDGWNFVFGEASLRERVGVWSIYRLGDPQKDYPLVLLRTLKTATHETGHMLGIAHCTLYECCMNGSNHLPEADSQPLWFCPEDEMKVLWACHLDPETRYARLAQFSRDHGLDREARFFLRSKDAVNRSPTRGR
jgi:archaemetzincin